MQIKKRRGIFYGWWVLAACFVIGMYTSGVIYYGFTALFEPIVNEFGWSHAQISFASSLRGMEIGLLAPIVGYLVDRFGAKPILFIGGVITGIGALVLTRINSLATFYGAFILLSIGLSACSSTAMIAAVANWFHRKASLAIGIMISGFGLSGLMVPVVVKLIDTAGWRRANFILGIGLFIVVLPLSLMVRRRPEDYGSLPDGDTAPASSDSPEREAPVEGANLTSKQALVCPTFWFLSIILAFQHMLTSSVTTHIMPYFSSINISRDVAGLAATGIPVISIAGRLGFGWLGDRLNKKYLTAAGFLMLFVGLLIFWGMRAGWFFPMTIFVILFGIGFGATNTMRAVLTRDCFGRQNFATIYGLVSGISMLGSIIGAPLSGYVYDELRTYRPVWLAFAFIALGCFVTMFFMPQVKVSGKEQTTASEEVKAGVGRK